MDLIYTNSAREDIGVLLDYELDLAFGADENNFECRIASASHCCEAGSLLYMEGTEYGGIVDSIQSDTEAQEITYIGRTWHGILNSKVLEPDSGSDYLVLSGEANAVLATLIGRMSLSSLFEASSENSGLTIKSYKMNRYITGYDGIIKMLGTVGGKLKMAFHNGKVVLSAVERHDYTQDEEFDADLVPFQAKRNFKSVNHLICLGSGELAERLVVHLYADEDGNISQTQTQKGIDEVSAIYEYSSVGTETELIAEGTKEFEGLLASDEISIDFDVDSDAYDVGDIVGAVDNITGLSAHAAIAKKIVTIKNGQITISLSPDTAKSGSSMEVGGGGESGGVTSFNGRDGEVSPESGDYTAAMVGAAPDGFGLGTTIANAPDYDANKIVDTGFYFAGTNTPALFSSPWCYIEHMKYPTDGYAKQIFFSTDGLVAERVQIGGVWGEHEYRNHDMRLGVEYRTTERWQGKPVYVKLCDYGPMPNNTAKTINNLFYGSCETVLEVQGYQVASSGKAVPFERGSNRASIDLGVNTYGHTTITTKVDMSSYTAHILAKYTKLD